MSRDEQFRWARIRKIAFVVVFLPLLLPLTALWLVIHLLRRMILYVLVWVLWASKGKDILFVYSDSPIWRDYMQTDVLPLVQDRAIVLNWSQRKSWRKWSLATQAFYAFGGERDFNPLIVLFHPFRRARVLRFWPAFKDWKRGYTRP